jgi:Flp pilus assembly protein TadG
MRKRLRSCSGQSVVEFALMFPLMFLLVVNAVNFGGLLYSYITVTNAARAGAAYMILGKSALGGAPVLPSTAAVQAIVNADLVSLPNASNAIVSVCGNFNGTTQWLNSSDKYVACTMPSNPPTDSTYADPQPATSILGTVQVQYTYCPFINSWNFPNLGVYSTLPGCTGSGNSLSGGTTITRVAGWTDECSGGTSSNSW